VSQSHAYILPAEDRGAPRYRLLLEVGGEAGAAGAVPIAIRDVSRTGLLVETQAELGGGSELNLDIPGLRSLSARIVWSSGNYYGAEFGTPLSPEELRSVYASSKVVWPEFGSLPRQGVSQSMSPGTQRVADVHVRGADLPVARRVQIMIGLSVMLWASAVAAFTIAL
jgi:hypothetical protein